MKTNLYLYRTKFSIKNLPNQEDFFEVQEFNYEYLLHSQAHAKKEFIRLRRLIEEKNPPHSAKLNQNVCLYLVRKSLDREEEFLLENIYSSIDYNKALEKSILEREELEITKEYNSGALRHSVPIYDMVYFKITIADGKCSNKNSTEVKHYFIDSRGPDEFKDFWGAYHYSILHQETELHKRRENHQKSEVSSFLDVKLFMIVKSSNGDKEFLIRDNDQYYPLEEPYITELKEKSSYEWEAARNGNQSLNFGTKPVLWDEKPFIKLHHRGRLNQDLLVLDQAYYQDLKEEVRFWNSLEYYYQVFEGESLSNPDRKRMFIHHDLQVCREAAIDFFDHIILNHTSGMGSQSNTPIISLILIKKKDYEPLYLRTTDFSKEQFLEAGMSEEKKLLESLGYSLGDEDNFPHFQP